MSALHRTWLVIRIAIAPITDARPTEPTVIVITSLMGTGPTLPNEWSIAPMAGLVKPMRRNFV